jgi:hypothetical protein
MVLPFSLNNKEISKPYRETLNFAGHNLKTFSTKSQNRRSQLESVVRRVTTKAQEVPLLYQLKFENSIQFNKLYLDFMASNGWVRQAT